jgi:hypothetical protein
MVRPDTLAAMAREALLMGPVLGAVMWLRRRTKRADGSGRCRA